MVRWLVIGRTVRWLDSWIGLVVRLGNSIVRWSDGSIVRWMVSCLFGWLVRFIIKGW